MKDRIKRVLERIAEAAERAGRDPAEVGLVAVTKTHPAAAVREAADAGLSVFGENYVQEARDKIEALADLDLSWHFIGHLQRNKAKYAVDLFDLIHSVDSLKLAKEIDKQAAKRAKVQDVLVQVNLGNEPTKSGAGQDEAADLCREAARLEHVKIRGLMTMPPFFDEPEKARPFFAALRRLRDRIAALSIEGVFMEALSMGMTGDFEAAVEEGATWVRIGTAIFGERQ
ncbi:MAG: YggS family pyridoxal phosphate-dependent enzyme [Desulfobacterales bacterium]|nr:YggS family pyridoxal phosphate-dependent enzyme [Desulfobacterales bacterium]